MLKAVPYEAAYNADLSLVRGFRRPPPSPTGGRRTAPTGTRSQATVYVVERGGAVVPLEVKSGKHYARHSALSHLLSDAEYDLSRAFVFNDKAWKSTERILCLPVYMVAFLKPVPLPEKMIYELPQ